MKEVRRKSVDPAVNHLLLKAYRQNDTLAWDRLDAMQPQCGFGRLAICCTECFEGPCRVNPFSTLEQETVCGRDRGDLAAATLLRRVRDGAAALLQLASARGADVDKGMAAVACFTSDVMSTRADLAPTLADAGQRILSVLTALSRTGDAQSAASATVNVNMGALRADAANIVLLGHVHPEFVARLRERAAHASAVADAPVNLVSICGNEGRGAAGLPLLTNYDSQELPLLTGAVDLLVVGNQCVMPATLRLASQRQVPVVHAATALDDAKAGQAVTEAIAHLRKRGSQVDIPDCTQQACMGVTPATTPQLAESILAAHRQGTLKGVVYLGGCGNIKHTQDDGLIKLAESLLKAGYMLATSGCAGTALAKAGMCRPEYDSPLRALLPANVPPVLHLGACHEAQAITDLARALPNVPLVIVMPELAHSKTLALAVALGAGGLPTIVSAAAIPGLSSEDTGKLLMPLEDFSQLVHVLEASLGRS